MIDLRRAEVVTGGLEISGSVVPVAEAIMAADDVSETSERPDSLPQRRRKTIGRIWQLVLSMLFFLLALNFANELLSGDTVTTRQRMLLAGYIGLMLLLACLHLVIFRLAIYRPKEASSDSTRLTESTWAPFQSAEVHDICAHLTPEEKGRLVSQGAQFGRKIAFLLSLPMIILACSFFYYIRVFFVLLGLSIIYVLAIEWRLIRDQQRRFRQTLCATEYAKARGYHPDTLRMFAVPWSRKAEAGNSSKPN